MAQAQIGRFLVGKLIGRGGMGTVWEARHDDGTPAAVKIVHTARGEHLGGAARREAQAAARLDHPAIVELYDFGEVTENLTPDIEAGYFWIAMELVEAASSGLAAIADWQSLRAALLRVLDALAHAHARGIIHRDIKPENILGADPTRLKLSDFGIAAGANPMEDRSRHDGTAGTPWTMAPEQFRRTTERQGPWTDIYGLACVAWKIATGRPPFEAESLMQLVVLHAEGELPPFGARFPVPEGLSVWLARCLAKRPLHRFRDAAGAAAALRALASPTGSGSVAGVADPLNTPTVMLSQMVTIPQHAVELSNRWRPDSPGTSTRPPEDPMLRPGSWRQLKRRPLAESAAGLGLLPLRDRTLAGRDDERDTLWACFAEVVKMPGTRIVAITGPSGSGRRHLARWVAEATNEQCGALSAFVVSNDDDPIRQLVTSLLWIPRTERDEVRAWMVRVADAIGFHGPATLDTIVDAIAPPADPLARSGLTRAQIWQAVYTVLRTTLAAFCRPAILALDGRALTAATLDLLEFLASHREPLPMLVVLTLDEDQPRPCMVHTTISLRPMSRSEHEHLVRSLIPATSKTIDLLYSWSDGIPRHSVAMLHDWAATGTLQKTGDGWNVAVEQLAPTMRSRRDWWVSRVRSTLEPPQLETACIAAVLGESVQGEVLQLTLAQLDMPASPNFDQLVESGLAYRHRLGFRFANKDIRQALVGLLTKERRQEAHAASAEAFRLDAERTKTRPPWQRIAEHWQKAGQRAQAFDALIAETRYHLTRSRPGQLPDLHRPMTAILRDWTLPDDDERRGWLALLSRRADVRSVSDTSAATPMLTLVDMAEARGWCEIAARASIEAAMLVGAMGRFDQALELTARARRQADKVDDPLLWLLADHTDGISLLRSGFPDRAAKVLKALVARAHSCGDALRAASATIVLAEVTVDPFAAEQLLLDAVEKLREARASLQLGDALNMLGEVYRRQRNYPRAREAYDASSYFLDQTTRVGQLLPQLNLGFVDLELEQYADARERLDGCVAQYRDAGEGFTQYVGMSLVGLSMALLGLDEVEAGAACLQEATETLDPARYDEDLALWLYRAAAAAGAAGRRKEALTAVAIALKSCRHVPGQPVQRDLEQLQQTLAAPE